MADPTAHGIPAAVSTGPPPRRLNRAVFASTVGNVIESYDFILYALMATVVLPSVFFPGQSTTSGVLLSFATYFVAFVARPVGGLFFGHIGDRHGRKRALLTTLLLMGVGTAGIGLVPGHDQIGAAAPVALVALRVCQGLALGGEWTGAALLAMESGSRREVGYRTGFPQAANLLGMSAATLVLLVLRLLPDMDFFAWGWRIAFLLSAALITLGMWLRLRVEETATFTGMVQAGTTSRWPLLDLVRHQPATVVLCTLLKCGDMVVYYLFTVFILAYGPTVGYDQSFLLLSVAIGAAVLGLATPLFGMLGDLLGHLRVAVAGAVAAALVCLCYFPVFNAGNELGTVLLILVSLTTYSMMFANQGAIFGLAFAPAWRYSGGSVVINTAGLIASGPAPFVTTALFATLGTTGVAGYGVGACLITVAASAVLLAGRHSGPDDLR
ncbi:MFS transporter [Pseudonocardia spinosispora]|uniref:MFS transporter n=1 Tax=Pseudonocardia spinosispora TaxID=103441 RepID=UPI000406B46C|nr:MFS transporter [Pseudonocardia spinosispora]